MNVQLAKERSVVEAPEPEGLLLARVADGGAWEAVRSLRAEMRRLARLGSPQATFVTAISEDGREVTASDPDARVLALGYKLDEES
ncbi:MAG TPA: hypothetical protein VEA19_04875 [Actinomycetota bacterium]|nr:hypothetical protein [Actinomycetota bacterium]